MPCPPHASQRNQKLGSAEPPHASGGEDAKSPTPALQLSYTSISCITQLDSRTSKLRPKLIFFVIVGLLFCSLATLETTEFVKLADDTSNDFSLLNVETNTSSAVVRQSRESQPEVVRVPVQKTRQPELLPTIPESVDASHDLIHVLCVIRT